ncbi:NUDIX hydrolase [Planoprotostelium fungivorum]|uniref:8-oxo-dGTP diphosphatase n=1 Tax=Planoprotostelium fungivorum TaxID=1890364 RepID=A0A2P6MRK0_9EUKA|nr:NUDIX hydrolase [Planoprotostelium fungivorum]
MTEIKDVVCAVVHQQNPFRILCTLRYPDAAAYPSCWEFPGGKVEKGETHQQALERECVEELGVRVIVADVPSCWSFDGRTEMKEGVNYLYRLHFYWAKLADNQQEPRALESQELRWMEPSVMSSVTFCPGDEGFIIALQNMRPK